MEDGQRQDLYDARNEHDACGVGFVANLDGRAAHGIVEAGIRVLENLVHRGAAGGDGKTGDGAGILVQMPDAFLRARCAAEGIRLPAAGRYGAGMIFLPREGAREREARQLIRAVLEEEGLGFLGWRGVPVDSAALGEMARARQPGIAQCFVDGGGLEPDGLERRLFLARRQIESRAADAGLPADSLYVASLSCRTVVYKGMMMGAQLGRFYTDLGAPDFVSALAVIHQRYSTNTFPSWRLAQPFRLMAHNGEINTLRGNLNQMRAREASLASELFGRDIRKVLPVLDETASDSACLDNALELLERAGRDVALAMMMLVPQAWGAKYPLGPELRGFFEYSAGLMEPWDGPAAVAFTDGVRVGALLDRNGLRPARYTVMRDGFIVLASETGVLDLPQAEVVEKGALRPGQMILADLEKRRLLKDGEIKSTRARRLPYRRWVEENKIVLHGLFNDVAPVAPDRARLLHRQRIFGYTREDLQLIVGPMAATGHEPVGSMGNDAPLAVLSERPQLLFAYFRQLFAQVTNPPIDPIREELVMSLMTFMGNAANILADGPRNARLIKLPHPILSNEDLERLQSLNLRHFSSATIPIGFPARGGEYALEESLERLCDRAERAALSRRALIVLSDRDLPDHEAPIPSLLAVSAVNQRLLRRGTRTGSSIIIQTGEAREVHHAALLLGYGATAVNPYLAFETVADLVERGALEAPVGVTAALENYIAALCAGLRKIMSKMGISTLRSYRGAQVFEAVGLHRDVVDRFFRGTASRIGGMDLGQICAEAQSRHASALAPPPEQGRLLPGGGHYRFRTDGERHLWTPDAIRLLQWSARRGDGALYREYAALINDQARKQSTLRGLFRFRGAEAVPLEEVEPASEIMKRFVTGAMSFGSISREAHETLAVAMNRIGAMSNSGEGGEDPARYRPLANGDSRCSAVKQVASGRFGVTTEYLVNARELQIKMAQGAKPGEGGQLPGHKVNAEIARVRHSTPGVTLISPPPHHDIYSIEDIKQLIFDLKNVNPEARVSVKLVAELGVGTIAAGVAKAHADMVLISGHDGGTGAAPLSSIKHAGIPWELGLAETQQTLIRNGLRDRIRVQVDGQLKTGRDVVVAALLGAEEFGFATAPLVVCGCVMMRKCHENTCPVGVATQDPELRRRFTGKPEHVVNFFRMVAEEARGHMAALGFRTMDEMIGRCERLEMNAAVSFWKTRGLDVSAILAAPRGGGAARRRTSPGKHAIDDVMDRDLIREAAPALEHGRRVEIRRPIRNVNRAVGTMLSGRIARRHGHAGLPDDTICCRFEGAAGQSFGAFAARGLTLVLEGEANDYLGKGLSGGRIVVRPPACVAYDPSRNTICGNVLLYGATSGEAYIRGRVGERFAVRNSGANAVVEGVGDHGCEYMTAGRVVVLGETGVNFAAGMSGGIAYVYDPANSFDGRCNLGMVDLELVEDEEDERELRTLIVRHVEYTGSDLARGLIANWDAARPLFVKVFPMEYRRVLGRMSREDEAIEREEPVNA
ncbi:MAG: glutamate synthase large subunit [Lentisphaerae bacterium]|nr:glutamate synthase large subunit [Lentisphaerota bacterium]